MTSAARICKSPSGFTLLEVVMVLAIAAVLLGGAVTMMVYNSDERELRNASGEIELLAKRARTIATLQQIPYAIEFRPGSVRLLPFGEAGQDETKTALGQTVGGEVVQTNTGNGPVHDRVNLDSNMTSFVRRWNTDEWLPMSDRVVHVWRFDPDGLCEPLGVRLNIGGNYIETIYHPLTATVCETSMEVK